MVTCFHHDQRRNPGVAAVQEKQEQEKGGKKEKGVYFPLKVANLAHFMSFSTASSSLKKKKKRALQLFQWMHMLGDQFNLRQKGLWVRVESALRGPLHSSHPEWRWVLEGKHRAVTSPSLVQSETSRVRMCPPILLPSPSASLKRTCWVAWWIYWGNW